jgi:hypothetical protein
MAPRGVIYVNSGKKVAVGYNSQVYGIWLIEATDDNPNPILSFPKTGEGWQSVNSEFLRIEKFGFVSQAESPSNFANLPPGQYQSPSLSYPPPPPPPAYQVNSGNLPSPVPQAYLSQANAGENLNSPDTSVSDSSANLKEVDGTQTVPVNSLPPDPSFGNNPNPAGLPPSYPRGGNVPNPQNPLYSQGQMQYPGPPQNFPQTQFVGQNHFPGELQPPGAYAGPPQGPQGFSGMPIQNSPSIYGQNIPQAPFNPYAQMQPQTQQPYGMPPPYPYIQPPMQQMPFGQPPMYPPNAGGLYYKQIKKSSNDSYAVASLVFGILGIPFFFFFGFFGVLAVYLGAKFNKRNRLAMASGQALEGKGLATAGSITGFIGVLFYVILLLVNLH